MSREAKSPKESSVMRLRCALVVALVIVGVPACRGGGVVRVFDGVEVRGRFINDWAYASYARGVEWEARGQLEDALHFYDEALEQDDESVELWTRIGDVRCRLKRPDAEEAFVEAEELDPSYEPLWRARAECAEKRGDGVAAAQHALRAVRSDPARDETVVLLVRLLVKNGQVKEAERWLRSALVGSPRSAVVWRAAVELASDRLPLLEARAREQLEDLPPSISGPRPSGTPRSKHPWLRVDEELVVGSLDAARRRAREAHLDVRKLAARAILVGRPQLALEEAELRVGANPSDSEARIALALACDLVGDPDRALATLADLPAEPEPVGPAGAALLAELLLRHESAKAASLWLGVSGSELTGQGAPRARLRRAFEGGQDE
jgi:tetratricopeptide (TPR) repeat protein